MRSSANAEDLPSLSFAGQQETYLNVKGTAEVVAAVRNCWASLWTPQAISYRHQNGIDQGSVAMAVVVQVMVSSEVSGILFTANPATGERSEIIINASFGLGEAVVSGQVTPDTYIVDKETVRAKDTIIGPKAQQIVADGSQGTRLADVDEGSRGQSSLTDDMLQQSSRTAIDIEKLYDGVPQDIEWAVVDEDLYLLQSRPVTNLPVQPHRGGLGTHSTRQDPLPTPERREHAGSDLSAVRGAVPDGGSRILAQRQGQHDARRWSKLRHLQRLRLQPGRSPQQPTSTRIAPKRS